jgi:HD superfamily phosphohydrolase
MPKYVKDCIYKQIKIPYLCQVFIDTPEFQRLRFIKQLGHVHYVYPSAVHTRFEHSLGVMYLAGKMVNMLRRTGANISNREKHLIQLAGLLHDIGHMAYSHFYDKLNESMNPGDPYAHHETRSVDALRVMNDRLKQLDRAELTFVRDAILGNIPHGAARPYLREIVCNKLCGLDVDKMDYLFRDAYHTGMHGFQSDYIIRNVRISPSGHIAFTEKARVDVEDLFKTRYSMHANVYRHHTVRKYEKIYWCAMKRICESGTRLDALTDFYLEHQLQAACPELFEHIWFRNLNHACETCADYNLHEPIHESGNVRQVPFVP